jgi:spore germination protein GerM
MAGAGGSGVVIFTLPAQAVATFSGGVTQTSARVGVNTVYTVTETDPGSTVTIG